MSAIVKTLEADLHSTVDENISAENRDGFENLVVERYRAALEADGSRVTREISREWVSGVREGFSTLQVAFEVEAA